jgi:hypothetical protein
MTRRGALPYRVRSFVDFSHSPRHREGPGKGSAAPELVPGRPRCLQMATAACLLRYSVKGAFQPTEKDQPVGNRG